MRTEYPIGTTIYNPEKCWNGYTLLNNISGRNARDAIFQRSNPDEKTEQNDGLAMVPLEIIDMNGNTVHGWDVTTGGMKHPNLLDNGHLLMNGMLETNSTGTMRDGHPREYDWDSNLVWECNAPVERHAVGGTLHRLENGNTLFVYKMMMPDAARMKISDMERRKINGLLSDCITEVTPDGEYVWDWKSHDHLVLDDWLRNDPSPNWTHFNCIQSLPENKWFDQGDKRFKPGNILVSGRCLGFIFIIEKESGEIVWRYYGDYKGGLSGQHSPRMIPKGYPGEGNIIVFDNGQSPLRLGTHGGNTLILEINPVTNTVEWVYDNGFYFFNAYGGHCERLPNGNTFIVETWGLRAFEITMDGEIVWEHVGDPRVIDLVTDATRVPYDHCPQLAALPRPEEKKVVPSEHTVTKPITCGPEGLIMKIEQIVEDWDSVKKRWEAWWNCDLHDRVVMQVGAPRDNVPPADIPEVDNKTKWTDVDFMIRRARETTRTTWWGGELLPMFWHGWSAGFTLPFGCEPHFEPDTVWVDPAPVGADGYPSFDGWQDSPWWSWMLEATEKAVRGSQGEYFVMPAWGNDAVDTLALMRGTEQFLTDIADNPAWVTEAVNTLSDIMIEMYKELRRVVDLGRDVIEGSVSGQRCWSPGRTLSFDCDTSCMVSPKVFQDMFLPPLVRTMELADRRIYHFDGAIALHQMDAVLETPEIHAVQWAPGAGREGIMQWLPVIKRIQAKGKAVIVYTTPDEVEPLLREVSPEGLCISIGCETESEGRKLLERVAKLF